MAHLSNIARTATVNSSGNESTDDALVGTAGADAYYLDSNGNITGDDTIVAFGKNDSLLSSKKIFDGNNDGIITFGPNGLLDIDRTSSRNAGPDQVGVGGIDGSSGLRYLGTRLDDEGLAIYAYADASVRPDGAMESGIGNDTLNGTSASDLFFFDTALGLNLGSDTITNFSAADRLISTVKLYDSNDSGFVNFGRNSLLDLPGSTGPSPQDPMQSFGGQVNISGTSGQDINRLQFDGQTTENGVTYYFYSLEGGANDTSLPGSL